MMKSWVWLLGFAILLALGLAIPACGGNDDDDTGNDDDIANDDDTSTDDDDTATGPTLEDYADSAREAAASIAQAQLESQLAILASDEMEGRQNLSPGGEKARDWLIGQMEQIPGLEPAGSNGWRQPFDLGVNLVGLLPGSDPGLADEYVIVSGHYDHLGMAGDGQIECRERNGDTICNGAADNGAGTIAALEIVRALAASEHGTRRSLLLVFWDAEEDGLRGSRYFVNEEPLVDLTAVQAMYSIDNVGGHIIPGVTQSFAIGIEYSDALREIVHAINDETGYTQFPVSSFFVGSDSGGRSDHLPFRESGVPVIFFGSGSPPEYHTPADELAIVDFAKLANIARHTLRLVAAAANREVRIGFVAEPGPHLDDAEALYALGQVVMADPEAAGLGDPALVGVLQSWMNNLEEYLENPPQTEEEWAAYDAFIRSILSVVYEYIG